MSHGQPEAAAPTAESGAVLDRARALLGAEATTLVDGVPTARPLSTEQLVDLVRTACEEKWRLRPTGAGLDPSRAWLRRPDLAVSSEALPDAFDHAPVDLNVRVGAGMRLSDLSARVASGGQWLALDPPGGRDITVGGVVGTGRAGPLRVQYGRPRDQVLGLTLVDGSGRVLSLGGRVVKNVAGFDLVRLATGSRGTIGMITDVTFRLYPKPEDDRTLVWCHDDVGEAWDTGRALATLPLPVAAAELLVGDWPEPVPAAAARTVLRLTGSKATNDRVAEEMAAAVAPPHRSLSGDASVALFDAVSVAESAGGDPFRGRTLPNAGRSVLAELAGSSDRVALHLLEGTVRGTFSAVPERGVHLVLRDCVEMAGGHMRMLHEPPEDGGRTLSGLAAGIRRVFDPAGILNVGGRDGA